MADCAKSQDTYLSLAYLCRKPDAEKGRCKFVSRAGPAMLFFFFFLAPTPFICIPNQTAGITTLRRGTFRAHCVDNLWNTVHCVGNAHGLLALGARSSMHAATLPAGSSTGLFAAAATSSRNEDSHGGFPVASTTLGCPDKATIGPSVPSGVT